MTLWRPRTRARRHTRVPNKNNRTLPVIGVAVLLAASLATAHEQEVGDGLPGTGHVGEPLVPANGKVLDFPAKKVSMLSWMTSEDITGTVQSSNDIWAYVSPSGREYAIVGMAEGTAFIEVTDPVNPKVVKFVKGARSTWRDMAVYQDYAYSVNETGGGIQVIDLAKIDRGKVRLRGSVTQRGLETSHNISIDQDSGFAYLSGSNLANGGLVAVDLSNPREPQVLQNNWPFHYVHDVQVVTYRKGVNAGRQIAFAFAGESGLQIIDVTDKDNIFTVNTLRYPGLAYCHSGWVDAKRRFLYVNDELDEIRSEGVETSTTYIYKVKNLENAKYRGAFTNGQESIDHNNMIRGDRLYQANYASGLRVFDVKKRKKPLEIAFFDTAPDHDHIDFDGAWGVYSNLPSGIVLISDIQRGLFVLLPPE